MDNHNQSGSSSSGADSSFGVLAMPYDEFDIMLKDINEEELERIGRDQEVKHLSAATFSDPAFPVQGILHGPNSRLMVPLIFQRARKPDSPIINVWCLIDTGSPFTCLTVKTLESFFGAGNVIDGQFYSFAIQDQSTRIECQVSRVGTHFEHVNILGIDSLRKLKLNLDINWDEDSFKLIKNDNHLYTTFIVIGIAGFFATYVGSYFILRGCSNIIRTLRKEYLAAVLQQDAFWFVQTSSGAVTSQLNTSIQKIEEGLGNKLGMLIRGFSMYFSSFFVSLIISWRLALICLISGPLAIWTLGIMGRITSKYAINMQKLNTEAATVVEEAVMNVKTVISCNGQEHMVRKYAKYLKEVLFNVKYFEFWAGLFEGFTLFECYVVVGFNVWFGIYWYFDGIISKPANCILIGNVMAMSSYNLGILGPHIMAILKARVAAAIIYETIDNGSKNKSIREEGALLEVTGGDIEMKNVKFGYPDRENLVLKSISWKAVAGTSVALVGKSGSGKSTLFALLTRLYEPMEGSITINGVAIEKLDKRELRQKIGIVEQGTIMENIILGREVTEEDAKKAAIVANADDFIRNIMPDKYNTRIGVGGVVLSGGQKQRIAIARAIVTDPKILLLDEATSALDSESELIVTHALNRAAEGRTTVIISHRLNTVKDVEKIYVVENGIVVEEGVHDELIIAGRIYSQLARAQEIKTTAPITPDSTQIPSSRPIQPCAKLTENAQLLEKNKKKKTTFRFGLGILYANLSGDFKKFLLVVLIAFLRSFEMNLMVIGNSIGFDALSSKYRSSYKYYANLALLVFILTGILQVIFEPLLHLYSGWVAENVIDRLRCRALRSLLYRPIHSLDESSQSPEQSVAIIAKYSQPCLGAFNFNFAYNISNVFSIVVSLIACFIFSWEMGLLTIGLCFVLLVIIFVNQLYGHHAHTRLAIADRTAELAIEIVRHTKTIQLLTVEEYFLSRYKFFQRQTEAFDEWIIIVESMHFAVSQLFPILGDFFSWVLLTKLAYDGNHQVGDLFRAVSYTSVVLWSILYSAPYIPDYIKAGSSAKELFKVIDDESVIKEAIEAGERPVITGQVVFQLVDFAYPSRSEHLVSRQMNFSVESGNCIALIGASGCGKSTVINLLERFYSVTNGRILLDDSNILTINLHHLRSHVALVSQEPVLFKGTILENITIGMGDISLNKVVEACRTAKAFDFIQTLPNGLETDVGERGQVLSGGQKQRIAIARALVRNPKILLLDEATSALDAESEEIVQGALNKAKIGRTCIIITHRLSSIQNCDAIYVIEKGAVVESGSHQKLMLKEGIYAKLVTAQMLS